MQSPAFQRHHKKALVTIESALYSTWERACILRQEPCIPISSKKCPVFYGKRPLFYVGKSLLFYERALYSNVIKEAPCILWKAPFILGERPVFFLWKAPCILRGTELCI